MKQSHLIYFQVTVAQTKQARKRLVRTGKKTNLFYLVILGAVNNNNNNKTFNNNFAKLADLFC